MSRTPRTPDEVVVNSVSRRFKPTLAAKARASEKPSQRKRVKEAILAHLPEGSTMSVDDLIAPLPVDPRRAQSTEGVEEEDSYDSDDEEDEEEEEGNSEAEDGSEDETESEEESESETQNETETGSD